MKSLNIFVLFFISFFILCQDATGQKQLSMVDSVVIDAPDSRSNMMDVYYINHDFKAEFRSFRKDTSSLKKDTSIISLKDKSGATERFYYYNGDLYSSREIGLYETDQGYALLRYLDMNLLSLNKNNSMITDEKIDNNVYYRSGFLGDLYFSGSNDYFSRRNSGHYQDSVAFFHCYEEQPYGAWVNKTENISGSNPGEQKIIS